METALGRRQTVFSDGRRSRLPYNFVPAICFHLSERSQVPWPQPLPEFATTAYGGSKRWKEKFVCGTEQRQQAETSFGRIWKGSNRSYSSWLSAHWKAVARIPKRYQRYPSSIALGVYTGRMEEEVKHLSFPDRRRAHFEVLTLGIPRDPADFIKDAHEIGHPRRAFARVPALMREVLEEVFLGDPFEIKSKRANFLKKWMKRAVQLRAEEQQLHAGLPPHLQPLLKDKKLLLWKEILLDLQYPDSKIVDEVCQGFPLTGWAQSSGVFQTRVKPPDSSMEQLEGMAKGLNMAVVASLESSEWMPVDQVAWDETMQEVANGWLAEEPHPDLGKQFIAKRFPIQQREDTSHRRLLDLRSKLYLWYVREAEGWRHRWNIGRHLRPTRLPKFRKQRQRTFGKDIWFEIGLQAIWSRCATFREAQNRCEETWWRSCIFKVLALPFGATGSVSAFLRISSAIAFIGSKGLCIPWSVFFDDYTALTPSGLELDTTFYAEALFKLLDINFASEGSKAPPFSDSFKTLGLVVNTENVGNREVKVGHTEERSKELLEYIDEILRHNSVGTKTLERLHGRIVWFRTFVFGRRLNAATRVLSWHSRRTGPSIRVDDQLRSALGTLRNHLVSSRHVSINRDINETWIIFTDGAFEPTNTQPASIGGVLVNPSGQVVSFFGAYLPAASPWRIPVEIETSNIWTGDPSFAGCCQDMVNEYSRQACSSLFGQRCSKICFRSCPCLDRPWSSFDCWICRIWIQMPFFLRGSRELQAIATRRMNLQGWTSKHPGLGKQAKSNWSCQSTCRSGESSGALTLSIKSLCVNVWQRWNHGPSNAPKISSAGTMTGFGFDPRQCNYWNQKGNQ